MTTATRPVRSKSASVVMVDRLRSLDGLRIAGWVRGSDGERGTATFEDRFVDGSWGDGIADLEP